MKLFEIKKESHKYLSGTLWNPLPGYPVFGGQIISQALNAAYETVDETAHIHSLHCYFLLPANVNQSIEYKIETTKNGNLIENRNLRAFQDNLIFTMSASFTKKYIEGAFHQQKKLEDDEYVVLKDLYRNIAPNVVSHMAFIDEYVTIWKGKKGYKYVIKQNLSQKDTACFIAFISGMFLLESALGILNVDMFSKDILKFVSLDHSLHFHCRSKDTVLFFIPECISINNGRSFCYGYIFDSKGKHLATAIQEGAL